MPSLAVLPSQLWNFAVTAGMGWDGVVLVLAGGAAGSGALLADGRHVLTAAHVLTANGGKLQNPISVQVTTPSGTTTIPAEAVSVHPLYDPINENHDLALIRLQTPAPTAAERYPIYRGSDEWGQSFIFGGYGTPGTGLTGLLETGPEKMWGKNRFEADMSELKTLGLVWNLLPSTHLTADLDSGLPQHDALGLLLGRHNLGLGSPEGIITPGDSGGPAFIHGAIAGVASYGASLSWGMTQPDADGEANGTYGELGVWQRVSAHQQWIDQTLRAAYTKAPSTPAEVVKNIPEGNSSTTLAYFLVQFLGVRETADAWVSVDFATRDGSATAYEDYLPVSGTLILYPGENHAVIPVEVIGDTLPETPETFYLDVTNPVGGSFGPGVVQLTAMRTILDDDWA